MGYAHWDRDEPSNNEDEHCGMMNTNLNGLWKDMVCSWSRYTICEFRTVRLISNNVPTEGVIEFYYDNVWGSICGDHFGKNEADVVCRQLGLPYAEPLKCCSALQQSSPCAPIKYDSVTCSGNEDSLGECTKLSVNYACDSTAFIKCSKEGIRLSNGLLYSGFIEVFKNGAWGTYCDIKADSFAVNLTCKSLGYSHMLNFTNQVEIGLWTGTPINLRDIECTGDETSIFECTEPYNVLCQHDHDVHVQCSTVCKEETLMNTIYVLSGVPVYEDIILEPCTIMHWLAETSEGSYIELVISEISIVGMDVSQTNVGYFSIFEPSGVSNIDPLFGDVIPFVRSTTSQLTLSVGAGYRRQHFKFKAVFSDIETPGCGIDELGSIVSCEHPSATLATFNYPSQYIDGSRQTWTIVAPSTSHYIMLTFIDFDIHDSQSCQNDYVTVDPDAVKSEKILERYCNSNIPPQYLKSSRHKMIIELCTDYGNNGRGFLAEYDTYSFDSSYKVSSTSLECPDGWQKYSTYCYTFEEESYYVTWTEAEEICSDKGAHLVSIKDGDEMDFIHSMLTTNWITDNYITYIGLSHRQSSTFAVYKWSDGRPLSYTAWYITTLEEDLSDRQPLGGSLEECTVISMLTLHSVNQWFEVACEYPSTNQFICKKETRHFQTSLIENQPSSSLPIVKNASCNINEFQCDNQECIHEVYKCDGYNDCVDGTDEQYCSVFKNCSADEFECNNGECIHQDMRCDFVTQCTDGTDELFCTRCEFGFQCYDGTCIPLRLRCDGTKDCPGSITEDEKDCLYWNQNQCEDDQMRCKNGECVSKDLICVHDIDSQSLPMACRDATHLDNCSQIHCPSETVKCPGSYCIAKHLQCNMIWDCPNGEDETNCESYECPGMFRCHSSKVCISASQKCNGVAECPHADDELYCSFECPTGCVCVGLTVKCQRTGWNVSKAQMLSESTRYISLSQLESYHARVRRSSSLLTIDDVLQMNFTRFQMLSSLNISWNGIESIATSSFSYQINLENLVLSGNKIKYLQAGCFDGLYKLKSLFIDNNGLVTIGPNVLKNAPSVAVIHMENNLLEDIDPDMFNGLSLTHLYTDDNQFCCMVSEATHCEPPSDIFSSCEDLMRISFLRVMMWILGVSALIGNVFVVIWRVRDNSYNNVQSFLITNLAISDFLMGVYMVIIAGADVYYRGEYAVYATIWRSSFLCHFAGALSMTSSEFSVFTLVIISIDRAISIGFPFSRLKLTRKKSYIIVTCGWLVAVTLGFLPVLGFSYFGDDFYGRPSVCLSLPLTSTRLSGWEYSVAIVLGLNLLCFFVIAISYIYIFVIVKKTAASAKKSVSNRTDVKMATKMAMIIFTDFCCWFPIILMGIIAQTGSWEIPVDVYVWSATLILPINASLNPYLYTILWINDAKKRKMRKLSSLQLTAHSTTRSVNNDKETSSFKVVHDSYNACNTKQNKLSAEQITDVELQLKRTLQFMHGRHIYHGHVVVDNVVIYKENVSL
ncbi:uncharacterized protein [Antedon mediterranea]|uniref:uncharacterized protein n=1 Tax=Antedon mediterranea TaxID=105859 RepID=UPI003AF706CC